MNKLFPCLIHRGKAAIALSFTKRGIWLVVRKIFPPVSVGNFRIVLCKEVVKTPSRGVFRRRLDNSVCNVLGVIDPALDSF